MVLSHFGIHRQGVHQLERANHSVHRGTQLMSHAGEELVLQAIAPGQLQVQLLQRTPSVAQGLRLLLAQAVDAVGQRQRQQSHFQGRTQLAGIHGDEHVRQVAQHHQRVDQPTEQERRPGDDEPARHAQAAPPGIQAGAEDAYGEQQRQQRGHAQRNAVGHAHRQYHDQRATQHQQLQQAIETTVDAAQLQEVAGELATEQAGSTDEQWRGGIRPPRAVWPEISYTGAVHRDLVKAERSDVKDVIEVADVTHAEVDEQVVHQHHQ
ncbi:hypothetical protein D9M71_343600 [compost metagenome]